MFFLFFVTIKPCHTQENRDELTTPVVEREIPSVLVSLFMVTSPTKKPFYLKWDDESDNYLELVQNISRNFTNMRLFRDRVVN